jgi:hypothetical protein
VHTVTCYCGSISSSASNGIKRSRCWTGDAERVVGRRLGERLEPLVRPIICLQGQSALGHGADALSVACY